MSVQNVMGERGMICTNCGAHLMETDQFCPKCGTKAIKDSRCPDCGALLRDGAKFCPKCGRLVGEKGSARGVSNDTLDIPIEAIERNILSETAAEIKADHRAGSTPRKTNSTRSTSIRSSSEKSMASRSASTHDSSEKGTSHKNQTSHGSSQSAPARKKVSNPEPPRKKKVVYREEDWEDEDWEDDDWDEDDDDDEGVDIITAMTVIVGCVLLVVVAVLGFHLYRQNVPKNYDKVAEEEQEEQEEQKQDQTQEPGGILEGGSGSEAEEISGTYTLTVIHNVNVRDNPSTSGTNVLKVAKEGETYTCYGSVNDGEWYEILLEDGSTGYVFHEYVSID